jgi:hypothetical protein
VSTDRRELDDDNSPRSLGSENAADEELQGLEEVEDEELDDETADAADDSGTDDDSPDDDSEQASLEELLAQRAAVRRGTDDSDEDSDIMALASELKTNYRESSMTRVAPVRARQEFVCARCHLVKPRVQLADGTRGLCRDCV